MAQHADIGWVERGRAHQIVDGLRVALGGLQQAARMKREFERGRVEVAGSAAMDHGAIEPPGCGEGTTGVAVSFRPLGPQRQDALVGCCRLFVPPAIAEYPGAQIRDDLVEYPGWRCRAAQLTSAMTGVPLQCTPLLGTASAVGIVAEVLDLGDGRRGDGVALTSTI